MNETAETCSPSARQYPQARSAVTNGKRLFVEEGDGRGPWARRLRDIMALHTADLGGADRVSEAQKSIVRRAAVLTVELERLEAEFSTGDAQPAQIDLYQRTANSMRRLLESVGLKRVPRDVTPDLATYLEASPQ